MFSPVLDRTPARRHPTGPRRKRRGRLYRPWLEPCEQRILLTEGLLANGPGVPSLLESVGANRAITTGPDVQQMPSVAVDPADPQHVVIAYMDRALVPTGYAGIGVAVSRDGGSNWQHTAVPLPSGFDQGAANPMVRFDSQGHVFVSFMAATFKGPQPALTNADFGDRGLPGIQSNNGVFVARSDNGGLIWNPPIAVVSHTYSGQPVDFEVTPDLAIDTFRTLPDGSPNPRYGAMYETWTRIYPAGQFPGDPTATGGTDVMLAVSKDQGETWQTLLQTQPGTGLQVSVIQDPANGGEAPLGYWAASTSPTWRSGRKGTSTSRISVAATFRSSIPWTAARASSAPTMPRISGSRSASDSYPYPAGFIGQPPNQFRTNTVRAIAADPTRPGTVYATEANLVADPTGNIVTDPADIVFARSIDYGVTWQRTFLVGPSTTHILNDDNDGQSATGLNPDDVITNQALPRLTVDAQGDVAVIWYDTRRDPKNHLLDVFGTVSTDGGLTFSPNFRITDQSFDADAGAFTDATGQTNYYLGDSLGLAVANQTVYAAWTDTRNGNQDVFFTREPISTAPDPPNDRFEPNNTPETATDLGTVVKDHVPKLAIPSGDEDWFRLKAASTGDLTISATPSAPTTALRLELWDASGMTRLATGTAAPGPGVEQLVFPGQAGQSYLIHVVPGVLIAEASTAATSPRYTLDVQSLTADLGTVVHSVQTGTLHLGDGAYYLLTAGASGSLDATLTPGPNVMGSLNLQVLDPGNR